MLDSITVCASGSVGVTFGAFTFLSLLIFSKLQEDSRLFWFNAPKNVKNFVLRMIFHLRFFMSLIDKKDNLKT